MFKENNNGFWEIKEKDGREKKREKKKDIYCGPRIIKEGTALSYPVKLKSGKSCLRRFRPCESWKREGRFEIIFLILLQKWKPMYSWEEKLK